MQIKIQSISHNRGEIRLLRNISFQVESGESIVISGPSGDGKSLLFSIMCGLTQPDKGQVLIDEKNVFLMSSQQNQLLRKYLVSVFQKPALISNLSLLENFLLPLNLHYPYMDREEKTNKITALTDKMGLTDFLNERTGVLSVGQAALASFVRGLLLETKCFIWDAPLIEIDPQYTSVVKSLLAELKSTGSTIIMLSNRQDLVTEFADRHFVLSEGILRQHDVK